MSSRIRFVYVALGLVLLLRFLFAPTVAKTYQDEEKVIITTTLQSAPHITGRFQRFTIQESGFPRLNITTFVIPEYRYGETLIITGKVKRQVLTNEKIVYSIYLPKISPVINSQRDILFSFRSNIQNFYSQNLSQTQAALMTGMVFGVKEDIPQDFSSDLRNTGVLHVVAASGMNVSIIGGVFLSLFQVFLKRRTALLASISGIAIYALLAGLQPSIVRAAIMGSVAFVGLYLGRQYTALHVLFLTGFLMLLLDPRLLSDVGFQLSFLATSGILIIKPLLGRFHNKEKDNKALGLLREDFLTTFSAQIATFPILLMTFGSFGLISLVVNTIVLWTVPFIMILGSLAGIVGLIINPLGAVLLYLILPFLVYFETVIRFFGQFPLLITFSSSAFLILGYYLCLSGFILFKQSKK